MDTIRPRSPRDPFAAARYGDIQTWYITAEDRIRAVRGFSAAQCESALKLPELQKTVERAVRSRLRMLRVAAAVTTTHYAWCWRTGLIEIGPIPPADGIDEGGVIVFARGRAAALTRVIETLSRHGYDGRPLVPGVPEASTASAAVDALIEWVDMCAKGNGGDDRSGVVFGRQILVED
jgi:hypothetical protein